MDERDAALAHEATQADEGGQVPRPAHRHGDDGQTCRARLPEEPAPGLTRDQRVPAVLGEPAALAEDADLLAAEAQRGLGVEDRTMGRLHARGGNA